MSSRPSRLDILAIAAHRDDVEQTCGGTLLKASQRGQRTGILDLTKARLGRAERRKIATGSRRRGKDPGSVVAAGARYSRRQSRKHVGESAEGCERDSGDPAACGYPSLLEGRHPDHYRGSILGYEACFLAGLKEARATKGSQFSVVSYQRAGLRLGPASAFKIIYATLYYDIRPTFVVDISDQFDGKFASIWPTNRNSAIRSRQRSLPCPRRDSSASRLDGSILRRSGRRDLCRAIPAERSGIDRRSAGNSCKVHLAPDNFDNSCEEKIE